MALASGQGQAWLLRMHHSKPLLLQARSSWAGAGRPPAVARRAGSRRAAPTLGAAAFLGVAFLAAGFLAAGFLAAAAFLGAMIVGCCGRADGVRAREGFGDDV
jgi:hypothetical protein